MLEAFVLFDGVSLLQSFVDPEELDMSTGEPSLLESIPSYCSVCMPTFAMEVPTIPVVVALHVGHPSVDLVTRHCYYERNHSFQKGRGSWLGRCSFLCFKILQGAFVK